MEELKIPKCMSELKDKKAAKGGKTFFLMKIRGEPLPEVKWFFGENEITEEFQPEHFKTSVKENEHIYRLDVEDVTEDHYGKIKVVATNENGESVKEVSHSLLYAWSLYRRANEYQTKPQVDLNSKYSVLQNLCK